MNPRVFKPETPLRVIIPAVLIACAVAGFIIFATWQSTVGVVESKKTGTITKKEFVPLQEKQIIVDRRGQLTTQFKEGDYILTVDVPGNDGKSSKQYHVWLPDKASYDAVKVGDRYDVGPALIPEEK